LKAEVVFSQGRITGDPYPVLRIETGRQSEGRNAIVLSMTCSAYEENRVAACRELERIAEAINALETISAFWGDGVCDAPIWPGAYLTEGDEPIRDVVRRAAGWRKP
jgi:hypothetical protein